MSENPSPSEFTMTFSAVNANHELSPATVSIPILIDALNDFDQGARAYAPSELAKSKDTPIVSIIGIHHGSLEIHCHSAPEYAMFPAQFNTDLEQHNWDAMPLEAYRAAKKLHKTTVRLGANLSIKTDASLTPKLLMLVSDPTPTREIGMVRGSLEIQGQIIQTGGAKPAIDFRSDADGRILHGISVDTETARRVGHLLYTPIVIRGDAIWNAETWEIEDFKFTEFLERPYQEPSAALRELHEILGNTWKNVDVEKFMAEVRGGD